MKNNNGDSIQPFNLNLINLTDFLDLRINVKYL